MEPRPGSATAQAAPPLSSQERAAPAPELPAAPPAEVPDPTAGDEVFDRYARLVTAVLGVPVGLVSLVSTTGQVFPGAVGLPEPWQQTRCTDLSHSFCQHVVATDTPLVVSDARQDQRLSGNLAITDIGVIAYAGFPLHDADGVAVGSLCAIDTTPRTWSAHDLAVLSDLAATASSELVLRRTVTEAAAARDSELAALAKVSATIESVGALGRIALSLSDAESVEELSVIMAEQGQAALGADGGAVAVPASGDPGTLVSYISTSLGEDTRAQYSHLPLDVQLPVTRAARTATRVLVPDLATARACSSAMEEVVRTTGCQAWASLPLLARGQLLGVLSVGWREAQDFGTDQLELLETYAGQCAQALQRLAAREAERASTQQARAAAAAERLSAQRQASLVAIAQALAGAERHEDVLAVLDAQGSALLGASGSGLCLTEPGGTHVRTLATASFDADLRAHVQRVPADFPMPIVHTATTGTAHYLEDLATTVAAFPGARDLYTAAGVQASVCVPLTDRSGLLGSMSMAFLEARTWDVQERELLEAFAAMTGQALARIASHAAEQTALAAAAGIAETLQRSMLTPPPEPDHLEVAVRYAAAADHAEVGGDWYDAFVTAEGLTSLVIGDVTGHDMAAAAVMGQLRNLVRGIAFTLDHSPARVLAAVDRAAAGLGIDTVATAVLAQVEQSPEHRAAGTRLLRWSNAGHVPPLLIEADGTTRYLEPPSDLVLGWDPMTQRHDHEVVLAPGMTVLLYTDGLIERRGVSLDRGMAWLAQAAAELAGGSTEELCESLVALVGDHLDDDVALLALRAHREDAPRPRAAGPARVPDGLERARRAARRDRL
ncbi:SpoIIE family protein phosphatase [Quadrisphaera setariae]|uniref:SpoIIE family protein phosphatase n=1 Tax=Quadrisphaera setariae TaxID=2593304 RepID=A0A5C8ZI83_9ACTN|nr:SpoIIE family protein phosphatase [Quadrisphaera setariae]TXR57567.1 SpoIIE family protein phosphatase [Quadrisphaera setariae]